jgi:hypothetical protein
MLTINCITNVRFQVLTAAIRTSETSVDNHFTRQYIPEDNSEHYITNVLNVYTLCFYLTQIAVANTGRYIITNTSTTSV